MQSNESNTAGMAESIVGGHFTVTTARWNFCPHCGQKLEAAWKYCAGCGKLIGQGAAPWTFTYPYPGITVTPTVGPEPCAFDGLPPGAYGLYCGCPKCSSRC
jgi:hypothetical protein